MKKNFLIAKSVKNDDVFFHVLEENKDELISFFPVRIVEINALVELIFDYSRRKGQNKELKQLVLTSIREITICVDSFTWDPILYYPLREDEIKEVYRCYLLRSGCR